MSDLIWYAIALQDGPNLKKACGSLVQLCFKLN